MMISQSTKKNIIQIIAMIFTVGFVSLTMIAHLESKEKYENEIRATQAKLKQLATTAHTAEKEKRLIKKIEHMIPSNVGPGEKIALIESIKQASLKFSIPIETICAVIQVESSWDKHAISHVGATGYMQLMGTTAEEMRKKYKIGKGDITDTYINIMCGTAYLRFLYDKFNDKYSGDALAIMVYVAYNRGHNSRYLKKELSFLSKDSYFNKIKKAFKNMRG